MDICNELGSPILGGVSYAAWGYITKRPRTQQEWEWGVESMRVAAEYAKMTGDVNICVECVNRFETFFLNITEDAVQFCKDVGTGNVKVHLDCFHMIREEKSFSGAVETCGKGYLGYIHVNENDRDIPGTGLGPLKEFFTAVKKAGYEGPLTIELVAKFGRASRLGERSRGVLDAGAVSCALVLKTMAESIKDCMC